MTIQFPRGNSTANNNTTGPQGSLTYDTQTNNLRLHDGSTSGGFPIPKEEDVEALARTGTGVELTTVGGQTFSHKASDRAVSFDYYLDDGSNPTYSDGTSIKFNNGRNTSPHYSTSTGLFTAPVAGAYHFSAHVFRDGTADTNNITYIYISVNGGGRWTGAASGIIPGIPASFGVFVNCTLQLNAGDTVAVRTNGTTVNGSEGATWFNGFLL